MSDFDPDAYLGQGGAATAEFDPDAYLKGTSGSTEFDPDAYLGIKKQESLTPETDKATDWQTGAAALPNPEDPYAQMGVAPTPGELEQMVAHSPAAQVANQALEVAGKAYRGGQKLLRKGVEANLTYLSPLGTGELYPESTGIPTVTRGIIKGLGGAVEGVTDPTNAAIMGGMLLAPELGVPMAVRQAISAGFVAQMATQFPELYKAFIAAPDVQTKVEILTQALTNVGFMGVAGKHAIVGEPFRALGYTMGGPPEPGVLAPPIQSPGFMLGAPPGQPRVNLPVTTTPEGQVVVGGPGTAPRTVTAGQDIGTTVDRFAALTNEAQGLQLEVDRLRQAGLPVHPTLSDRINQINAELQTVGEPARGFTAEVEPVKTQEELQAERERGRIARARGVQPIEQPLGGEQYAGSEQGAETTDGDVRAREGEQLPQGNVPGADEGLRGDKGEGAPVARPTPVPSQGAVGPPEDYVEGAPAFDQFYRSKAFQAGWTKERRIDEYNRLYHKGSPENAALLDPTQFEEAAQGPLQPLVRDAQGDWTDAAYDAIDDAYLKDKPINANLWHDIREEAAPIGYTREGNLYQPDLKMKYSRDPASGREYSLSDEHRQSFQPVPQEDPLFARLRGYLRKRYGREVEQVSAPDLQAGRGVLGERGPNIIQRVDQAAKAYGSRVTWFRGVDGPLHQSMGAHSGGTIFLNVDMSGGEPVHQVFAHELTHFLERNHPDLYNRLQYEILRATRNKPWAQEGYAKTVIAHYKPEQFHHELTADFMAEAVRDPVRFQQLMGQKPGLMARFRSAFNDFVEWSKRKFLGAKIDPNTASSLVSNLNQVRRNALGIFEQARVPVEGEGRGALFREAQPKDIPDKWQKIIDANPVLKDPKFKSEAERYNLYLHTARDAGLPVAEQAKFIASMMKGELIKPTQPPEFQEARPKRPIGPIGAVREAIKGKEMARVQSEDEFFGKIWPKMLRATGLTTRNPLVGARMAVNDMAKWLKENPQFKDYYEKDFRKTRQFIEKGFGRKLTDPEFRLFRLLNGVFSNQTPLKMNTRESINGLKHFITEGNFDAIRTRLEPKVNAAGVNIVSRTLDPNNPFAITTGSSPNKAFAVGHVINNVIKRFGGDTDKAIDFLKQPVTTKELQAFNREAGFRGPVGDIGAIRHAVDFATGQQELIPRMFIFGKKVGAYTLNNLGDARYNTVDVWESRFVKSYLKGMLEKNPGIAAGANEHEVFRTFVEEFNRIWRDQINPKENSSALQAGRWFYMIESARKAGYTRGVTNDVISQYAKEHFQEGEPLFAPSGKYDQGRGRPGDAGGLGEATSGIPPPAGPGGSAAEPEFRESRVKRGEEEPEFVRRPGKRARPQDLASSEPFVSRFANRYVSEDVKQGKVGEITPGQGYSTKDLVQLGMQLPREQVQRSIQRVVNGGLDPMVDAMAIRAEAARLSERSTRLSEIAGRQPNNRKAARAADQAFQEVTAFHNGPVAALKNAWHGAGMSMQGEHPVDLSTLNGAREEYMRTTGAKTISPKVDRRLAKAAGEFKKRITAEDLAKDRWIRQIDALGAGKMLPSPESVRNNIMRRMRNEPC